MNPYSIMRRQGQGARELADLPIDPNGNPVVFQGAPENFAEFLASHPEYQTGDSRTTNYGPGGPSAPPDVQQFYDQQWISAHPAKYRETPQFPSYQREDPPPPRGIFHYEGPDNRPGSKHTPDPVLSNQLAQEKKYPRFGA